MDAQACPEALNDELLAEPLLDDTGDVCQDVQVPLPPPVVSGPANPDKTMTNDKVYLALLHSEIKSCATVLLNPKFSAIPC
jgi:hypothetical protein